MFTKVIFHTCIAVSFLSLAIPSFAASSDTVKAIKEAALATNDKAVIAAVKTLEKSFLYKLIAIVEEHHSAAPAASATPLTDDEVKDQITERVQAEHASSAVGSARFQNIEWGAMRKERGKKIFSGRYSWDARNPAGHDFRAFTATFDTKTNTLTDVSFGPAPRSGGGAPPGAFSLSGN